MRLEDLSYDYPEHLVATEPCEGFRILFKAPDLPPQEITKSKLFTLFRKGDVLAINDTAVLKRRVFTDQDEILFLDQQTGGASEPPVSSPDEGESWRVLFKAGGRPLGDELHLPGGVRAWLKEKNIPQVLEVSTPLTEDYFQIHGELALPPYIQKRRGERKSRPEDTQWYQPHWAKHPGSLASPTASLHFKDSDLNDLKGRGVEVVPLTLHVGLGTFNPIRAEILDDHQMHFEWASISEPNFKACTDCKNRGGRVWALGTTVVRALESAAQGKLTWSSGRHEGLSDLFIHPGYEFNLVSGLLTNFHQPHSTLLALVMAFAGEASLRETYRQAISEQFRLFSYGDLSVWTR